MVVYWDSSALVSLIGRAPEAPRYRNIAQEFGVTTWWGTFVDCVSCPRGKCPSQVSESYRMLLDLSREWREIDPSERLRRTATRMLRTHVLSAGDALQLGAALLASDFEPHVVRFLSEDRQLKRAAEREGFLVD